MSARNLQWRQYDDRRCFVCYYTYIKHHNSSFHNDSKSFDNDSRSFNNDYESFHNHDWCKSSCYYFLRSVGWSADNEWLWNIQ